MFHIAHKWTAETVRIRNQQDAVDAAFRSGDLSGLGALPSDVLLRAAQSYREGAAYQRRLCSESATCAANPDILGVTEWIEAAQELAIRQETFADSLLGLVPEPQAEPSPLRNLTVKSIA